MGKSSQLVCPRMADATSGQDVHSFIVLGHWGFHRRTLGSPDAAQDRFEADAMLIHGPRLDAGVGMLVLHQGYLVREVFLNSCWLASSALARLRARHTTAVPEPLQVIPSPLRSHRATQPLLHPLGDLWSAPDPSILWRVQESGSQFLLLFLREQHGTACSVLTAIANPFFPSFVPAPNDGANPSGRVAESLGDLLWRLASYE